jgi:hypothetical protein
MTAVLCFVDLPVSSLHSAPSVRLFLFEHKLSGKVNWNLPTEPIRGHKTSSCVPFHVLWDMAVIPQMRTAPHSSQHCCCVHCHDNLLISLLAEATSVLPEWWLLAPPSLARAGWIHQSGVQARRRLIEANRLAGSLHTYFSAPPCRFRFQGVLIGRHRALARNTYCPEAFLLR